LRFAAAVVAVNTMPGEDFERVGAYLTQRGRIPDKRRLEKFVSGGANGSPSH
jgi:hypothetical protein